MLTQDHIQQILQEAASDPRVQTVLLAGSYAYGKPTGESDLDVRCLTNDGSDWAEFNRMRFDTTVEIFFNPPEKILAYFAEDQQSNEACCISAWDQGILFYDAQGAGMRMKNLANELFKKGPTHGEWKKSPKQGMWTKLGGEMISFSLL